MSDPERPYLHLYSGGRFYTEEPEENEFHLEDIAHALSMLCRFAGQVPEFYSVAEHSLLVSQFSPPRYQLWGLLHDASEAYVVDLPRPVKYLPALEPYRVYEQRVMEALLRHLHISPIEEPPAVRRADAFVYQLEARALGVHGPRRSGRRALPLRMLPPAEAEAEFLRQARYLIRGTP